jgi:hypothetical protein
MARWMLLGLFSLTGLFGSLPAVFLAGCRKEAPPQPYVRTIEIGEPCSYKYNIGKGTSEIMILS